MSPQKGRLVADAIRGLPVEKALDTLRFQTNKGSGIVINLLESAIANAEHNDGVDIDDLFVEKIFVEFDRVPRDINSCSGTTINRIILMKTLNIN